MDREQLQPATAVVCDALAALLGARDGGWTIELQVTDGVVRKVYRHEAIGRRGLEQFDPEPIPAESA